MGMPRDQTETINGPFVLCIRTQRGSYFVSSLAIASVVEHVGAYPAYPYTPPVEQAHHQLTSPPVLPVFSPQLQPLPSGAHTSQRYQPVSILQAIPPIPLRTTWVEETAKDRHHPLLSLRPFLPPAFLRAKVPLRALTRSRLAHRLLRLLRLLRLHSHILHSRAQLRFHTLHLRMPARNSPRARGQCTLSNSPLIRRLPSLN